MGMVSKSAWALSAAVASGRCSSATTIPLRAARLRMAPARLHVESARYVAPANLSLALAVGGRPIRRSLPSSGPPVLLHGVVLDGGRTAPRAPI